MFDWRGGFILRTGKVDERGKSKRPRRAFTDDELRRVVADSGPRGIVHFTAARTGLRNDELRQLIWEDLRLDDAIPSVRVRVVCAKNKKEEYVPLIPEIIEVLKAHRPAKCSPLDLVFPRQVPRASRLEKDCATNRIAYCDETGRYVDFHALRHTFATFLQRHDVPQRFAMKLMRHIDMKLTAKGYTDETQLPIYDAIKALPRLGKHTQIRAQISGAEGRDVSQAVAKVGGECGEQKADFPSENGVSCRSLPLVARESGRRDSNSRHSRWQRDALPTELRPRFRGQDTKGSFRRHARFFSPAMKNIRAPSRPPNAEKIACRGMRLCVVIAPHFPWTNA